MAMILWGIYFTFIRIPIRQVGWFWPSYFAMLGVPIIWIYMLVRRIKLEKLPNSKITFLSLLNALLLTGGTFSYNFAVMSGQTSIVAPIAGSYPVLFVVLAYFVFKDRLNKQQIFGIVTTLTGIVLLSVLDLAKRKKISCQKSAPI